MPSKVDINKEVSKTLTETEFLDVYLENSEQLPKEEILKVDKQVNEMSMSNTSSIKKETNDNQNSQNEKKEEPNEDGESKHDTKNSSKF